MGRQKENKKLVPDEIATSILEYLPITVLILLKCELISKQFNTITNPFWKRLWNAEHDIKLKRNHRFACIQLFLYINKKRSHSMYPSTIYGFETKLVVLGNMNSGKSSFVQRFITNQFVANIDPTIDDSFHKDIVIFNRKYTLEVFDTIQPEDHSVMHEIAIRKCQGAMFCCNSSRDSVYALETYIKMFTRIKDEDALNLPMVIAICKSDQEEAPLEEVNTIAEEYHIKHVFVTSALEGTNVKEAFERLTLLTVDPLEMHLDWVTRFENRKRIVDTGKKNCTLT